jgi:hypothetical protein
MRAALLLAATVLLLAGCGGGTKQRVANHQQPQLVARLTGKAAEKVGATACRHLPQGTLPASSSTDDKIAALRAYLQRVHPGDSVQAMVKGCRRELNL